MSFGNISLFFVRTAQFTFMKYEFPFFLPQNCYKNGF